MKNKVIYLLLGAVLFSAPAVTRAQDKKAEGQPSKDQLREQLKNMTPEQRAAKMKEWREKHAGQNGDANHRGPGPGGPGVDPEKRREEMTKFVKALGLDPEEIKNLSPEERSKKIREAAEKKHAELNKKKEDGTITDEEKQMLERMEARRRMMQERQSEGGPKPGGAKPEADKK